LIAQAIVVVSISVELLCRLPPMLPLQGVVREVSGLVSPLWREHPEQVPRSVFVRRCLFDVGSDVDLRSGCGAEDGGRHLLPGPLSSLCIVCVVLCCLFAPAVLGICSVILSALQRPTSCKRELFEFIALARRRLCAWQQVKNGRLGSYLGQHVVVESMTHSHSHTWCIVPRECSALSVARGSLLAVL
jgi:hypothetical protein